MSRSSPSSVSSGSSSGSARSPRAARGDRRKIFGARAERAVAHWYRDRGYTVLAANWRCNEGELDLVLGGPGEASYVFCEVKARSSSSFGTGLDAVTVLKQRRVRRLAVRWLAERRTRSERARKSFRPLRFDVAAVSVGTEGELVVEVLEGSF